MVAGRFEPAAHVLRAFGSRPEQAPVARRATGTAYAVRVAIGSRRARVEDVHELAGGMPHVTVDTGPTGNPVYQVGGRSFVFFRNPRPDAVDPATGERYQDVIVIWVPSEADKQALVQDEKSPFFSTGHFDGHPSVLVRAGRIPELTLQELSELIEDAWMSRASRRRATDWLDGAPQQPTSRRRRPAGPAR